MLAANSRGSTLVQDMPEWKRSVLGGSKASFGKKEKKSILEQRQSLPIYRLKDELVKVRYDLISMIIVFSPQFHLSQRVPCRCHLFTSEPMFKLPIYENKNIKVLYLSLLQKWNNYYQTVGQF